ncbi:MAG: oxidoreductase [Planctomycetia bacterium]|nr:oxidoreductase [Planctomycetia bacterium]
MEWLLVAVAVLVASGLMAVVMTSFPRLSTFWGAVGGGAGCAIGLFAVVRVLWSGKVESLRWGWDVPYGSFSLELDPLSGFFAIPILVLSGLAAIYGSRYVAVFWDRKSVGELWFFFNLLVAGMLIVVLARNGMLFLVAWEVMSLAAFFLITFEHEKQEVRDAGKTFLIATHLGTAFLLTMFVLLGAESGSLDFADFANSPSTVSADLLFLLALVGFGTKAGLMPLHVWLPEAYPVAPSYVSAVMSGAMSKLGIYGLLRVLMFLSDVQPWWGWLLIGAGAISGILGILSALGQSDLKRLLAYSSIENIGIISMGMGLGVLGTSSQNPVLMVLGFAGALFHVINHAIFKGLLFLGAGVVFQATETCDLDRLGGLLKRMPWTGSAILIGSVAIAGLPPLNGFASEFVLYRACFNREGLLAALSTSIPCVAVIGSLALIGGLAAFAFVRVFGIAFLGEPRTPHAAGARSPNDRMSLPILLLAAGCIAIGLLSPLVFEKILPVVAQITHYELAMIESPAARASVPLSVVARVGCALFLLAGGLALVRRWLLSGREVAVSGTWGCGYSRSTPRIQYTASSFAQPAIGFFAPFFRTYTKLRAPRGLFPQSASLATENTDLSTDLIYHPLFGAVGRLLGKLRWLQQGRVHMYVLYVGCTILALMIWYVSMELPPADASMSGTVVERSP